MVQMKAFFPLDERIYYELFVQYLALAKRPAKGGITDQFTKQFHAHHAQ